MAKLLLLIGTVLTTVSFVPYIRDIIRHGVRPRLVSWVIWSVLLGLMTGIAAQERQWGSVLVSGVSALGCISVVALGWRYANRGVTKLERATLMAAGAGLVAWFVLENPLAVMSIALVVDAIAYVPTIIHGWQQPEEESIVAYAIGMVGESIIILASGLMHAGVIGFVYPVYAASFGLLMVGIIAVSKWWHEAQGSFATETY